MAYAFIDISASGVMKVSGQSRCRRELVLLSAARTGYGEKGRPTKLASDRCSVRLQPIPANCTGERSSMGVDAENMVLVAVRSR